MHGDHTQAVRPFLIGSTWTTGQGQPFESINPATGGRNGLIGAASKADVDFAVRTAKAAQARPEWRQMLPHQRAAILHRIADLIEVNAEELADRQMRENGKLRRECVTQAAGGAAAYRYFAAICETMPSEIAPSRGDHLSMVLYEPYGVVAAITPWNSPLTLESQKVAAALAAGNAVVLKPSEFTPTIALRIAELALEAGLPPGIFNVVTGLGAETGTALVAHPDVRLISFTGGTATGKAIAREAAGRMAAVALELGGKSPHIVFADADLDKALEGVLHGVFSSTGQSCIAGTRLFVERSVYEGFVQKLATATNALRVGPPDDAQSQIAPLSSFIHRDKVETMVDMAREDGATVLAGGSRPGDARLANGAYFLPTILGNVSNSARICQQEVFGPVLCVLPFDNEADLVAQANDTLFGLAAGVWTQDFPKAWRVARAIEAGTVWINTYKTLSVSVPFGGFKESGSGREKGFFGIRTYQEPKTVMVGL
ncbi:aldehyde dehydrogenase [Variovorax sp. J22P271]|uniref:aldehyde dehydrogenase n=1 Tax=Variovorax davisae TaxID=3053515 RepID=UPI002576AA12|nr:aldehyde dehydrogenase [Variovorax sp. J22P271]MDM0032021.1 aldehyde dehydrogenase [Variovorax sp. J22P271]